MQSASVRLTAPNLINFREGIAMTKAELVAYIAKETKVAKKAIDSVLNSLVDAVH